MPKSQKAPIACIVYAARSAPDSEERSTRSQIDEVRARVESEGGRTVVGEPFAESGRSGYHGERGEQLNAAMAAARTAAAEHGEAELWVFHSSRLGRGSGERGKRSLLKIYADLLYEGVQIRSVSDDEFCRSPMLIGIASAQNHKYAADHSAHVARGKRHALRQGRWAGGPAPDGYELKAELNARSQRQSRLVKDPAREPVIRALFDLAEQGHGDATVARRMNTAGHRTKAGKPWNRRRVQSTVTNPIYAGRVARRGEGSIKGKTYRRLPEVEVVEGQHDAIIEPERFDRIQAARRARDWAAEGRARARTQRENGARGGRPTSRYALAKLAVCDRCGSRMYVSTSPYKRKDGSHARGYMCANVKFSTGLCNQPKVDAEKVDRAILAYLDDLFIDYEAFVAELSRGADEQVHTVQTALDASLEEIDRLDRRAGQIEMDYVRQVEAENHAGIDLATRMLGRAKAERADAERRIGECRTALDELRDRPADTALDTFNELKRALRGVGGSGLGEVNERLRGEFEEFRLDTMPDGIVGVLPVLKPRDFDVQAAFRAWLDAGSPEPTAKQVEAHEAVGRASDPRWVTGSEQIRPPAKALLVGDPNPPYSQE